MNHSKPFVCYLDNKSVEPEDNFTGFAQGEFDGGTEQAYSGQTAKELMTTQEAAREGMAVIDGGATQTIGSVCCGRTFGDMGKAASEGSPHRVFPPSPSRTPPRIAA